MDEAEFDQFAEEYKQLHTTNIRASGESPEYFAEYKIADVAKILSSRGLSIRNRNVLDFGAGVGTSVPYFQKHLPDCRVTCLDVSRKSLSLGESHYADKAQFVHFDGVHIPFPDDHFDLVFTACVLHHIPHTEHPSILKELRRVLRPDGTLVVFEHNPYNPLTVHAVNTCPFDENAVLLRPHQLLRDVKQAGFQGTKVSYRIFFPRALAALRGLEPWLEWLPLGAQYSVHARKR
jgi:SAM-dependent methyltransferase